MADQTLRRNLDRAFDPGPDFPNSQLLSTTMAMLVSVDDALDIQPRAEAFDRFWTGVAKIPVTFQRRTIVLTVPHIVLRVAAVVLMLIVAVAAIGVFLATHHVPAQPTPAHPFSVGPSKLCGAPRSPDTLSPIPEKMLSPTIGWAAGALRTTDGGVHWLDVSPTSVSERSPGGYAEFFLDSTHAWVAEVAGSSKACSDHVVTFMTADGGRTWTHAAPIAIHPAAPSDVTWEGSGRAHWLYFIDARNGWLLVESGPGSFMAPLWNVGALYRTTNGGLTWTLVANNPGSAALKPFGSGCHVGDGISFASASTAWMPFFCPPASGPPTGLLVTHDGGISWAFQELPVSTSEAPVVLDTKHATISADSGGLLVTSDGGATWTIRVLPPGSGLVDFLNPSEGWAIVNVAAAPLTNWHLYHTSNGGETWSPVGTSLPSPLYGYPNGLVFIDGNNGFLAMGNGLAAPDQLFLKTVDGGRTWTPVQPAISRASP